MNSIASSRRLALVAAVIFLGFTACGDPASDPAGSSGPAVIQVAGAADGSARSAATEDDSSGDAANSTKMMAAPMIYTYAGQAEGTVPDLTAPAGSWYFAAGSAPSVEAIAAVAAALGVEGEVRVLPADQGGGWQVGSSDYSEANVTVSTDAMQNWWYSGGMYETMSSPACELYPPGDPAADIEGEALPVCEGPPPPVGVPSAAEAEARAADFFAALGFAADGLEFETFADEWNANVTAYLHLEGTRTSAAMSMSFGAEGAITWASGFLGTPVRGDDYPRIGVEAAVARLNEQSAAWTTISARSESAGSSGSAVEPASEPAVDVPTDTVLVDPMPAVTIEPGLIEELPMEPITVTLRNARPSLEILWAADNSVWLVPGYSFDSDESGTYTVIAIADEFMQVVEPVIEPLPVEVGPPTTDTDVPATPVPDTVVASPSPLDCPTFVVPTGSTDVPIEYEDGAEWIGLCVADAHAVAEAMGYELRVARQDGVDLAVTADFRENRFDVAVEGGIVTGILAVG